MITNGSGIGKSLSRDSLYGVRRGAGVGRGLGVGVHLPVHGFGVVVGLGVAVGVSVPVGVAVAVGVGAGKQKNSIELSGVPSLPYPPANHM